MVPNKWLAPLRGDASPGKTRFANLAAPAQLQGGVSGADLSSLLERPLDEYRRADVHPLPSTADREGYGGDRHFDYWMSGLKDYLLVKSALQRHGLSLGEGFRILDFGCASGRVLRHFLVNEPLAEAWACDINPRHAEWVRRFLPSSARIFHSPPLPTLPLEDRTLSLVYAFSVFTHIGESELAWLCELRRVLKPGGLAYLTIESDRTWSTLSPEHELVRLLLNVRDRIQDWDVTPEMFRSPMPADRVVLSWQSGPGSHAVVFHSLDYIHSVWGRFLDVLEVIPAGHDYQDVVVLRKR